MRERGVQSRRGRSIEPERVRRSSPPGGPGGGNFWQALAIVALIAATAGWTTVAVLALRPAQVAQASPTDAVTPSDSGAAPSDVADASDEPVVPSHTVPALEALLPTAVSGTTLETQSWTGDATLADDPWSVTVTTYLTSVGKKPVDLQFAQAYDPAAGTDPSAPTGIDLTVGVFTVKGTEAAALRDTLIKAWKGDYPDLVTSSVTVGGKKVTEGDFGDDTIPKSYWYVSGDKVFDVETTDQALATAALSALGTPGSSAPSKAPASAAPSHAPAASPS